MMSNEPPRRVVTFYSYKGGCGRTMALANVAWRLARTHALHVIAVDWDLEAPGLHRYFGYSDRDLIDKPGVLDFMEDWLAGLTKGDYAPPEAAKWLLRPKGLPDGDAGSLLFLPAGKLDDHYGTRLAQFDWLSFYREGDGGMAIEKLRHQLVQDSDLVLCDSRTGLADIAGICTMHIPDGVVLMGSPNEQSLDGIERVAVAIADPGTSRSGRARPKVWVSIARVPIVEETGLSRAWLDRHKGWFEAGVAADLWTNEEHPNGLRSYLIPQRAHWALGEQIVQDDVVADPNEPLLLAFNRLTETLYEWASDQHPSLRPGGPTESVNEARSRAAEAEKRNDAAGLGIALYDLAVALFNAGEMDEAFAQMQKASGIHLALGARAHYGRDQRWLGNLRRSQGFLDEALELGDKALEISIDVGNKQDEAAALHLIGNVYFSQRRFEDALQHYERAKQIIDYLGNKPLQGFVRISMALALLEKREHAATRAMLDDVEKILPPAARREHGVVAGVRGDIAREEGKHADAMEFYEDALAVFEDVGDRKSRGEALTKIGMLLRRQGELDRAIRQFDRAVEAMGKGWDKRYQGVALREKGCALRDQGQIARAIAAFDQSLVVLDKPSDRFEEALTLREKGLALRKEGRMDEALEALEQAVPHFQHFREMEQVEATRREIDATRVLMASMTAG